MKKIYIYILIILWMGFIFIMSSMNSMESNNMSKGLINDATKTTSNVESSSTNKNNIVDRLNVPVRKCAHATEFAVLSVVVLFALRSSGKVSNKFSILLSIVICFLYACTDEFHQLYVVGRTSSFIDVLIDTFGSCIGCAVYILVDLFKCKMSS